MARKLSLEGMLSPTEAPPDGNGEPVDDQADDGTNGGESRGGLRATRPSALKEGQAQARGEAPWLQADDPRVGLRTTQADGHQAQDQHVRRGRRGPRWQAALLRDRPTRKAARRRLTRPAEPAAENDAEAPDRGAVPLLLAGRPSANPRSIVRNSPRRTPSQPSERST